MAKDTSNNIKIHFRAEGEQELTNAIKVLSAATTQLKNSQMQLAQSMGLTEKERKKSIASGQLALRNQRNMNQAVSQGSMTFSVFRSKLLLASFAIGLVGDSVGRLVRAFAEQESSEKRIEAALESTGNISGLTAKQIREMTARLEDVGVIGDEVNNKVASLLLTFTNIRGEAFERTMIAANNMAISISGGIPTFEQLKSSALQLGKALQDPAGQLGALSRSGFTFTGTQKEMIKSLVSQNKLMEAQSIILDAADTQFGKLNETMAKTVDGAYAQMNNASGTLAENIGKALAPATIELVKSLKELFKDLSSNTRQIVVVTKTIIDLAAAFAIYKTALALANKQSKLMLALNAALRPQTLLVSGAAFLAAKGFYELNDAMTDDIKSGDDLDNVFKKIATSQNNAEKQIDKTTQKIQKQSLEMKIANELTIANINIENSALLQLTSEQIKQFEQKRRELLINQELLKLSKEEQRTKRDNIEALVDSRIAYETYISKIREYVKVAKEQNAQDKLQESIQKAIVQNQNDSIINTAKLIAVRAGDKSEVKRIDNIVELNKRLVAVTGQSQDLELLFESGMGLQDMSDVMFQSNSQFDKMVQLMIESILTGKDLDEELNKVKDTLKAIANEPTPFEKFQEEATLALTAFQGFSQSYSQLVDERMNRELEALKTTRDYEQASQEERENMENRVEQRFRSQRRKAFKIEKASNLAQATMDVSAAIAEALKKGPAFAAFVGALGAAQIAAIAAQPAPRFATGGSFITSGPTQMLVGESGAERVTVQPLGGRNARQSSGSVQNININVSAPLVDETILDVIIPKIEEAGKLNIA
ncbi:hypothetical protein [uncultured Mediterranean phage uvMED]|nr:hypothetical protein [uncultured Mediterranean phage uvMED]